ncbi:hypothetical protein BS78_03G171500 [Paspalum vaginatum]|nr:hypothetical protein BS78_03G171500 [Paspalum vaginatum]
MGDRAYAPASKPVPVRATNGTANGGGGPPRPAPPSMLPGGRVPPPPMYRPKPAQSRPAPRRRPRRSARGWCCACCLWLTLLLVGLAFLCAIAAGALYVVYRPRAPSFAVTSLRLAALNVSDSDALTSRVEFTVTARNPNAKLAFAYGDMAASFTSGSGADLGDGVVPGFLHAPGNTTVIRASASAAAETIDPVQAAALRSRRSHVVAAELDAKVGVQIGRFRSKRIGVRVTCAGVAAGLASPEPAAPAPAPAPAPEAEPAVVVAAAPAPARRRGRSPPRAVVRASTASSSSSAGKMTPTDAKCKVRIKIWIWSF